MDAVCSENAEIDALTHLKSQLGINRTYNSNSTAWEFQMYWSKNQKGKYRAKGSNKISYNRQKIHSVDLNQYTTDYHAQIDLSMPNKHLNVSNNYLSHIEKTAAAFIWRNKECIELPVFFMFLDSNS